MSRSCRAEASVRDRQDACEGTDRQTGVDSLSDSSWCSGSWSSDMFRIQLPVLVSYAAELAVLLIVMEMALMMLSRTSVLGLEITNNKKAASFELFPRFVT